MDVLLYGMKIMISAFKIIYTDYVHMCQAFVNMYFTTYTY